MGTLLPLPKGGRTPQIFGPCLLWPKGWMDEAGTWHGGRSQPSRLCVRWGPSPLPKRGRSPLPNFWFSSIVVKRLDASRCNLVYGYRPQPRDFVLGGDPVRLPKKGAELTQIFGPCLLWPNVWIDQDSTWHKGRLQPRRLCVRWGPSSPPTKGVEPPPHFSAHSVVAKRLDASRCHLVWR